MATYNGLRTVRGLGIGSWASGILGAVFCWWVPLGMVLSLVGLVLGFIGWVSARGRSTAAGWFAIGMLISFLALVLDLAIARAGIELIRMHAFP